MPARAKRESAALKRFVDEVLLEMSSQKIKKQKLSDRKLYHRKLYPVVITDVEKIEKKARRVAAIRY